MSRNDAKQEIRIMIMIVLERVILIELDKIKN